MDDDRTVELKQLLERVPPSLREALEQADPENALDLARQFLASDAEDQAGMMEFIASEGPRRVRDLKTKHRDGTPTASDLADWLDP